MNANDVFKLVLGSGAVYLIVAACGHSSGGVGGHGHDGGGEVKDALADVNQSGSRLEAQYYAGADGSRAFAGMKDKQTGKDCAYATAADGTERCLPFGPGVSASTRYYSDAGCTKPILELSVACAGSSPPYVTTADTTCGESKFHVYKAAGAYTAGADIYVSTPKACVKVKTPAGVDWEATGTELAATTFVAGTLTSE